MDVRELDRQAPQAGGLSVVKGRAPERATREALLVLADGSVWRGRTAMAFSAVAGEVSVVGRVALVGAGGRLTGRGMASLRAHLEIARAAEPGTRMRGCLTAAGATTPLHAKVALAVVRGEIGRP